MRQDFVLALKDGEILGNLSISLTSRSADYNLASMCNLKSTFGNRIREDIIKVIEMKFNASIKALAMEFDKENHFLIKVYYKEKNMKAIESLDATLTAVLFN